MFIPMSYAVKDDQGAPDGTVEKTCKYCQSKFAVPENEADNYKNDVCENCQDAFNKDVAAATSALMKNPTEASEAIKNALGK